MPTSIEFIPAASAAQIERIATLAQQIWYEYYIPIIGQAQVDYMVPKFQSSAAMQGQITQGYEYFMVSHADELLGYFAVQAQPAEGCLFISKLYLQQAGRGSGTGRLALEFIEDLARRRSLDYLWLTVNKANPAVQVYEKWGFRIVDSLRIDIGGGFVMDDFRMEKTVQPEVGHA